MKKKITFLLPSVFDHFKLLWLSYDFSCHKSNSLGASLVKSVIISFFFLGKMPRVGCATFVSVQYNDLFESRFFFSLWSVTGWKSRGHFSKKLNLQQCFFFFSFFSVSNCWTAASHRILCENKTATAEKHVTVCGHDLQMQQVNSTCLICLMC